MAADLTWSVLIANRGEIAVRIVRACKDAGYRSVAVYAEDDRDALHVQLADEAWSLEGSLARHTYLDAEKILAIAERTQVDAIHPGVGFLSEDATFAEAVIARGFTWIGPPPEAIRALGDKVSARKVAAAVNAPLAVGTPDPVTSAAEIEAFVAEQGLPIVIKAAHGGGGRGMKVIEDVSEISEAFDSAVRESTAAFGRGECFVEQYLDRPRHVETQILADTHGNVVVLGTRDCSLQRRHQKLVEEAPAPFLSDAQEKILFDASRAIMREAGYVGAGTCEFLVTRDGRISFLEVNTRLQVEHPVTEETTGIDLVREQFRIARGEALGYTDPATRGHSIEFRINGEDPGRDFLPSPGTITTWNIPSGPGVRLDSGFRAGDVISGGFDSLLAKLIVTGSTRQEAIERARRALSEFEVAGIATGLPFHRLVLTEPAFVPDASAETFDIHTRWIETEFTHDLVPYAETVAAQESSAATRERITVEVGGKRMDVTVPSVLLMRGARRPGKPAPRKRRRVQAAQHSGDTVTAPMQGTIVKIAVAEGQQVSAGDLLLVLEAMKMEQPILAHRDGVVGPVRAEEGETVTTGTVLLEIVDA